MILPNFNIAFLGNMNNNFFAAARHLRDRGFNCTLILFNNEMQHFLPSADSHATQKANWIRRVSWGAGWTYPFAAKAQIKKDLAGFDLLIGCGYAPAFTAKAGLKLDFFCPYGADIYEKTMFRWQELDEWLAVIQQRKSFQNVKNVCAPKLTDLYEQQLNKFLSHAVRHPIFLPMVYLESRQNDFSPEQAKTIEAFNEVRTQSDFILVSHARHIWQSVNGPSEKGNNLLIEAWKYFDDAYPYLKKKLIFFEYGPDVSKSKRKIEELDLGNVVFWFKIQPRKIILELLQKADALAGDFVNGWQYNGIISEGCATSTPLITYRLESSGSQKAELPPIFNAKTPEEIFKAIETIYLNPEYAKEIGQGGANWYQKTIDVFVNLIEQAILSKQKQKG